MKLYDIPRESKIMEECSDGSTYFTFHRLDGMYSYCTTARGAVVHLRATTELEKVQEGVYIIKPELIMTEQKGDCECGSCEDHE